jgi:molybdopterin converting factor subunit 1
MRVTVRLFAMLREEAGVERVELEVPASATAEDAWRHLVQLHPALTARRRSLTVAVNRRYAGWQDPIAEGDEIAFIPPVSGG